MFDHILVTTDGSTLGNHALPHAAELARRYGSALTLLHVIPDPMTPATFGDFPKYARTYDAECERLLNHGEDILQRAHALMGLPEARISAVQARGRPTAQVIAEEADRLGAKLVVMGTHGRSGVRRAIFGSVAEGVVRRVHVPVLLVREPTRTDRRTLEAQPPEPRTGTPV